MNYLEKTYLLRLKIDLFLLSAGGDGEVGRRVMAKRYKVSFWDNKHILKCLMKMSVPLCGHTKSHWIVHFKWVTFMPCDWYTAVRRESSWEREEEGHREHQREGNRNRSRDKRCTRSFQMVFESLLLDFCIFHPCSFQNLDGYINKIPKLSSPSFSLLFSCLS